MSLPHYYTRLAPFRDLFLPGRPILTYHHVGPRPRGTRIKGLYVSPRLFARQMTELHSEGFSTAAFDSITVPAAPGARRLFLTFDDGFRDVMENALPVLQQHRFSAILFLVADLLGRTSEWQL